MTVDITQDEMNILNLNGISAESAKARVDYLRATGLDDNIIRQQFTDTINELKPITKISANDSAKIQNWQKQGAITPFEQAKRKSVVFNGTYDNIDKNANLGLSEEQIAKRNEYDRIRKQRELDYENRQKELEQEKAILKAQRKAKNAERDKRVNNGTASFFDRVGSYLDRQAEISERTNIQYQPDDIVIQMSGVNKPKNIDKSKPIGFRESLGNSFMTGSWLPYAGGYVSEADTKKAREIAQHIRNGESIRQDELDFINHKLEQHQEEAVRGYTWGGSIAKDFLPSLIRFGGEMATGGWVLKAMGLTKALPATATIGQKVMHGAGEMIKTGTVNTILPHGWNDTFQNYQERMFNNEVQLTDKGQWIFQESEEKPSTAFMKSLGQTYIMFASEASGELLGIPVKGATAAVNKYIGSPISKYLQSNKALCDFVKKSIPEFSKLYEKMNNLPVKGECVDWLKSKVKFDGFFEELGEEVVEDVLNLTIGTNNEKRSLENYAKAIFKSPDEWAVLAGAIALQGGTLSVASHVLGNHLEQNGATDEQIVDILQNLSEADKEQVVENLIQNGELNIDSTMEQRIEKNINTVTESLLQSGKFTDKEQAEKVARLGVSMLSNISEKTGISAEDLINEDMAEIEQIDREEFVDSDNVLQGSVVYNRNVPSIGEYLDKLVEDYNNLPADYDNTEDIERRMAEMDILGKIASGEELSLEDTEKVNDLIADYEAKGNEQFADVVRATLDNLQKSNNNIEKHFGDTAQNITQNIKSDILNILEENGLDKSEFNFEDVRIYGSYSTGTNKETSDLDVIVQYSGSMREDDAFNMLNDEKLTIEDVNGRTVEIDINPINVEQSGTVDENLKYFEGLEPKSQRYNQAAMISGINPKQRIDVIDLTSKFSNAKKLTRKDLSNYIKTLIGTSLKPKDKKTILNFVKRSKRIGKPDIYIPNHIANSSKVEKKYKGERNTAVNNITDLIQNSVLIDIEPNHKKTSKPDIDNYLRFYVPVKINSDIYTVRIIAENNTKNNLFNILDGNIYDVIIDKKIQASALIPANKQRSIMKPASNNSINGNDTNINPETITIEEMLKGVQSADGKAYYQSVYHGTPHRFDEFSLDSIGTGEGHQAHGWGLYFAGNKNVSEEYRKLLSKSLKNAKYDNVPIGKTELNLLYPSVMEALTLKSKESAIKELNKLKTDYEKSKDKTGFIGNAARAFLSEYPRQLKILNNIDENKITGVNKGQLFEVDIPESDVLLDENKKIKEQSKKVIKALQELCRNEGFNYMKLVAGFGEKSEPQTGKQIYSNLRNYVQWQAENNGNKISDENSAKEASLLLNKYGIKGITYDGRQDGRCYVIFDDKAIKVLKTYYQAQRQNKLFIDNEKAEEIADRLTKVKGSFIPAENLIKLFKDADESTIVHEFAHWWLEKLVKYSAESEELQEDLKEIRKFVKNHGEPFTTEQHERFARGFEAYIRTGSAKTNRLKKLFEDFKNALLSLYDSIKSLGFDENEIPEINNLFDRLLTTENQRIQAAVFDRCNNIQAQILEIRNNQEKELAEIDEIYKSNIERNLKDTRKQKQVEEYLRLADKATSRVPKAVKEYQSRYRNATFEILEKATGYKRQFIANPKNWEKVQDKIENMADPFSSGNGMQASWREFYADSGVSYDNMETDGDYNLAYQAFDVLQSDNYLPQETFEGEEKIGKFFGTFDYLAGKVMSLRGENKDAAFEALTSIFDNIPAMPDAAMQEIHDKLSDISDTFIEQKSNERSKGLRNVSLTSQLRTFVSHKMHEMKAYDPETKRHIRLSEVNKLYSLLKYATDVQATKEIIRTINAHAIKQLENRQKHILHKEIQKQVKINSKLIKVGALKRGKFDWKTNTVFADLQQMNRLSQEDAKKEYLNLINADNAVLGEERESIEDNPTSRLDAPTDFQKSLKVKFLEYKANKVNNLNLTATRTLLEDILELKFEGRRAKNDEELKKALSRYDYQTDLVSIINANANNESAKFIARFVAGDLPLTSEGTLANWESLLTSTFNRETAKKYSLLKTESDVEVFAHRKCLEFYNKALDIYKLRRSNDGAVNKAKNLWDKALDFDNIQPLVKLFNEYEDEVYSFKQITFNKDTEKFVKTNVEISHAQLITLYAWSLNPELKKRLITQFVGENHPEGEQRLNDMFSKLSDQDKQFAWAMVDICDSMYEDTNEVFIRTTGLSLPRVDNYIPSKTERIGSDLDMMHENMLRSTNPSFIKQRKNCGRIKMDPQSPLAIIFPQINKTARYIVMSEKVNFYNRIFQAPDVKAALIESYGKKSGTKIHQVLLNQLATSTYENYARSITVGKNLIDTVASNYITSKIGGNLKVMFSQLTSVINYAENMPTHLWATEFTKALANPKETISFMFDNCEYLQARLAGNSQNEIISTLTNESDKFRSLRNWCTSNTKYGDILAIIFGGKPYVDYLMKNGRTKEQAFEKFVEDTLRSQQSGHNSATSAWQKKQAQNAFTRMVFAFNNTNLQYERKFIDAVSNYVKGDISKQEFLKAIAIYKVFNPILFTSFLTNLSLSSLIMGLAGGDDDALLNFGGDIFTAIICSNLKAYGFLGIIANAITSAIAAKMTGGRYFPDTLPLISDFESSMQKLLRGKSLEFSDYIEMIAGVGDYSTGVATTRLYNAAGGISDIAQGEIGTGLLRMTGYGKYRATVGATGKPPERGK